MSERRSMFSPPPSVSFKPESKSGFALPERRSMFSLPSLQESWEKQQHNNDLLKKTAQVGFAAALIRQFFK